MFSSCAELAGRACSAQVFRGSMELKLDNTRGETDAQVLPRSVMMSGAEFERLSAFIHAELGIKMPPAKKTLLESRLQKRLKTLSVTSFSDYCDYIFSPEGVSEELIHMIDLVTTNKTDFFREPHHFEYLSERAVPELVQRSGAGVKTPLRVWSAGCSSGEEPYTIAMVLNEFGRSNPSLGFDYSIISTDISTRVLEAARRGVYSEEKAEPIPQALRKRYLLRSRDNASAIVRIVPELRAKTIFRRLNFMDPEFRFSEPLDMIFCRNVVIYFDKATQARLFSKFCDCLSMGSYLFIGHSETLSGFDLPLDKVSTSVYRKI